MLWEVASGTASAGPVGRFNAEGFYAELRGRLAEQRTSLQGIASRAQAVVTAAAAAGTSAPMAGQPPLVPSRTHASAG